MKIKDNLDLLEYEVKSHNDDDILPQTNQYMFSLDKIQNPHSHIAMSKSSNQVNTLPCHSGKSPYVDRLDSNFNLTSKPSQKHDFEEPVVKYDSTKVADPRATPSKGFFSNYFP